MKTKKLLPNSKLISVFAILLGLIELSIYPIFLYGIIFGYLFIPLGIAQIILGIFLITANSTQSFKLIREPLAYITTVITLVATSGLLLTLLLLEFLALALGNSGIH